MQTAHTLALSDADRVSVQEYLAQKYGLPGAFDPSSIAGLQLWLKGDSGIGDSSFYSFDERGNTRALVSPTGTLSDSYLYDTYGQQLTTSGSTANTFRYGGAFGYVFDGLDRMDVRMRGYDPIAGRWLSRDPIGFGGGDVHLYRYVRNKPINWNDPVGLALPAVLAVPLVLGAGGALLAAGANAAGQWLTGEPIDQDEVGIAAGFGFLGGFLLPFTAGVSGAILLGASLGGWQYIATQYYKSRRDCKDLNLDTSELIMNIGLGGIGGKVGGGYAKPNPANRVQKWLSSKQTWSRLNTKFPRFVPPPLDWNPLAQSLDDALYDLQLIHANMLSRTAIPQGAFAAGVDEAPADKLTRRVVDKVYPTSSR